MRKLIGDGLVQPTKEHAMQTITDSKSPQNQWLIDAGVTRADAAFISTVSNTSRVAAPEAMARIKAALHLVHANTKRMLAQHLHNEGSRRYS
jgi:hypothetical protein